MKPEPAKTEEPKVTEVPDIWLMNTIRKNLNKVGLDVCVKKGEENETEDTAIEAEIVNDEDKK